MRTLTGSLEHLDPSALLRLLAVDQVVAATALFGETGHRRTLFV